MKKNIKICIFTETYYPNVGGGETQAKQLAFGLVEKGCEVIVITRRTEKSQLKNEFNGSLTIYRLPPVGRSHINKWGLLLSSFPALFRLRSNYDLILVCGFRVIGVSAVIMSMLLHKICVLKADNNGELSGEFFRGGLEKVKWNSGSPVFKTLLWLRNRILLVADGFIAISSLIAEEFTRCGVQNPGKLYRIPNSVDIATFHPVSNQIKCRLREKLCLPDKDILVIYTGRLVAYKGLPLLLRVWKELSRKYTCAGLVLVGGGSLDIYNCEAELKKYVLINQLGGSVFFYGEVHNVHEYLQACDIFVFPTEKEAFGISVIEAMACGLPVISTAVGGLRDILTDKDNGLLVQPGNEQELSFTLELLLSNDVLRNRFGKAGMLSVKNFYGTDQILKKYWSLCRTLMEDKR